MAIDVHVCSKAIRQLGKDLVEDVKPAYDPAVADLTEAAISYPAFGVLGFLLDTAYDEVRDYAIKYTNAGKDQLDEFRSSLEVIAAQWENAENNNQVMFK